ncbi:unnamed protein product [Orchesella dallaii]|uniref:Metalloendopeptidase n=1 Tax=Orchesella dallaii TaxID=48710 RepID=A0ABP1RVM6_9HEXA
MSNMTPHDKIIVHQAFDEYHKKTCIKFEQWNKRDNDYIEIDVVEDPNVCAKSNLCKIGGYQFAKFSRNCLSMAAVVHEMGHALCLSHEHQRADRDKYVSFHNCTSNQKIRDPDRYTAKGIYDYASQMHHRCHQCEYGGWPSAPNVTKCGMETTPGLSVLDADTINDLFDCQDSLKTILNCLLLIFILKEGINWISEFDFRLPTSSMASRKILDY